MVTRKTKPQLAAWNFQPCLSLIMPTEEASTKIPTVQGSENIQVGERIHMPVG